MSIHVGDLVRLRQRIHYWTESDPDAGPNIFEVGTLVRVTDVDNTFFLTNVPGTTYYYWLNEGSKWYTMLSPLEQLARVLEEDEAITTR